MNEIIWSKKYEKLFANNFMSAVSSLKHQQPSFMAVETEKKFSEPAEPIVVNKHKKVKINLGILVTWIAVLILTIIFWYFILKLFR